TGDGLAAKLLVQPGRQKAGDAAVPLLLIERFVTFKEGTERAAHASGRDVHVYAGFRYSLGLGQVVPPRLGGDIVVEETEGRLVVKPVGQARLYLVTKLPKAAKPAGGAAAETPAVAGSYRLFDDGRRFGTLTLHVDDAGELTGTFTSDRGGRKYDGK